MTNQEKKEKLEEDIKISNWQKSQMLIKKSSLNSMRYKETRDFLQSGF